MTNNELIYLTVVIVYVFAIFFISWWRSRGVKSQEDFMVAGRNAPAWLLVGSLICTWIGAGSLLGGGGRVYREGLSQLWMSAGAWVGIIIIYFLAARVQRISQFTVQDILEKRYHPSARVLGAIAVILGSTIIFAYQLRGVAFVIEYLFHVPQIYGIMITGGLIFGFTVFAGLKSILAMDMLNGLLIILAVFIGLPIMLTIIGTDSSLASGVEHVTTTLPETHFSIFGAHDLIWALGVFFPTFFLLLGESSMYQKFYSARSGGAVKGAVIGFFIGVVVVETALAFFALTASTHPNVHAWRTSHDAYIESVEEGASAEVLDQKWATFADVIKAKGDDVNRPATLEESTDLANRLYSNRTDSINLESAFNLPIWAGALLLAGGIAIVFSTGNSFMMAASTSFTRDIYQRFINKDADEKSAVVVQRISMLVIAAFAVLILTVFTTVWSMALAAYTIIGCTLTPVILAAFLWRRVTPAAGVTSLALGISVWVIMVTLIMTETLPHFEYDYIIYPAGGASILSLIVVSFFTKPKSKEEVDEFIPRKQKKVKDQA